MAVTTPLTQFADTEAARAADALTAARSALAARDAALPELRLAAERALEDAAKARTREAELRAGLATAPLPADAGQLAEDLEENLVAQQGIARTLAAAQDALADADGERAASATRLAARQAESTAAAAAAASLRADAERVDGWRQALSSGPVTAALTEARRARAAAPYLPARDRLRAVLDAGQQDDEMVELLRLRAADADAATTAIRARALAAEDALVTTAAGPDGAVTLARRRRDAAVERVRAVANEAGPRLAAALASLAAVPLDGGGPPVTVAEQSVMDGHRAAAVAAAAEEKAVLAGGRAVRDAEVALDTATTALLAANPDADPATADELAAQRTALVDAVAAHAAARAELTDDERRELTLWEVAVPVALRAATVDFLAAEATIDQLAGTDGPAVARELDEADTALAEALRTASRTARAAIRAAEELAVRRAAVERADALATGRRAAAVRGER